MKVLGVMVLILFSGEISLAQNGPGFRHYRGPVQWGKVWGWEKVRNPWAGTQFCQNKYQGEPKKIEACRQGAIRGWAHADFCATEHGTVSGYLTGYSWGVEDSFNMVTNGQVGRIKEAEGARAAAFMENKMLPGLQQAFDQGAQEGQSSGSSAAIASFRSAVIQHPGQGSLPLKEAPDAVYTWKPTDNAYQRYGIGTYPDGATILGSNSATWRWQVQPGFWQVETQCPWFDYNRNRSGYFSRFRIDDSYWAKSSVAFDKWTKRPMNRNEYESYSNVMLAPTGGGQEGNQPLFADLRSVYRKGFADAYEEKADYAFARALYDNLDNGAMHGSFDGAAAGEIYSFEMGKIREYNRLFELRAMDTYIQGHSSVYVSSFEKTYDTYASEPKLELKVSKVMGARGDNNIAPGEKIKARFNVFNLGGRGSAITAVGGGLDLQDVKPMQTHFEDVMGLQSRTYETNYLGEVSSRLKSGSRAELVLEVNGRALSMPITAEYPARIGAKKPALNTVMGSGSIYVTVEHNSKFESGAPYAVGLYINGEKVDAQTTPTPLGGRYGNSGDVRVDFSGVDPMDLIVGSVNVLVTLSLGDMEFERSEFTLSTPSHLETERLAEYFNAVVNGRGYVPVGETIDGVARLVSSHLIRRNRPQLENAKGKKKDNPWETLTEAQRTVVGVIAQRYQSSSQNGEAQEQYNALAADLASDAKSVLGSKKDKGKQGNFLTEVNKFSTLKYSVE